MGTHGVGKNKRCLSVAVPNEIVEFYQKQAAKSGLSMNAYLNVVLEDFFKRGLTVRKVVEVCPTSDDKKPGKRQA